jgi:hypothetical protein
MRELWRAPRHPNGRRDVGSQAGEQRSLTTEHLFATITEHMFASLDIRRLLTRATIS